MLHKTEAILSTFSHEKVEKLVIVTLRPALDTRIHVYELISQAFLP